MAGRSLLLDSMLDMRQRLQEQIRRSRAIRQPGQIEAESDADFSNPRRLGIGPATLGLTTLLGRVVTVLAGPHWYVVQFEGGLTQLPCSFLGAGTMGVVGARPLAQLAIDDLVLVAWNERMEHGIILGSLPQPMSNPALCLADAIGQGSGVGLQQERALRELFGSLNGGDITDWSSGRPFDSVQAGENGWITENGHLIFIDSRMLALRISEMCGLWAFADDELLRLLGRNMQVRTSASWCEHFDDEGETSILTQVFPYFWERQGAWKFGQKVYREVPVEQLQTDKPFLSMLEPLHDDQQPFGRVLRVDGYLGQGGLFQVRLPPVVETDDEDEPLDVNRAGVDRSLAAVFSQSVGLEGSLQITTAKSVLISKRIVQPSAKQRHTPEDGTGDTSENYRASSMQGNGPDHRISGQPLNEDEDTPELTALAGTADRHTYQAEYQAVHPFREHKRDWHTPDSNALGQMGGQLQAKIDFSKLRTKDYIPAPAMIPVRVDHRYKEVHYFPNNSYFELADNGTVLIGCGWGAQVEMTGGNIELRAPGDVRIRAGRSIVLEGGSDVVVRSRNCVDVSTTRGDIRIRSGDTLKLKADDVEIYSDGDITSRCINGGFRAWTQDVYLRSGAGDGGAGGIVLDAGKGLGVVTSYGKSIENYATEGVFHHLLNGAGAIILSNIFGLEGAVLGGSVAVEDCLAVGANLYVDDWIVSVSQHIVTAQAATYNYQTALLSGANLTAAQTKIARVAAAQTEIQDKGEEGFAANYTGCVYAVNGHGDDDLIADTLFLYRSTEQYGTAEQVVFEARWQQIARLTGQTMDTWTEEDEGGTYPYPGADVWVDSEAYKQCDPKIFDVAAGSPKATTEDAYKAPQYAEATSLVLDGNYYVVDATSW